MVKRKKYLASYGEIPRPIINVQEKIRETALHLFGDASTIGTSPVTYAIIQQTSTTTQRFISRKLLLSKKNISIPRLEFVAVMVANLDENITNSLQRIKVIVVHGWSNGVIVW